MSQVAKPFTTQMMVHFDDGDPGGITFFPNYFRFSHRALELNLIHHGIPWRDWYDHPEWGVPLRHVEAEFSRPLFPGHLCRIQQSVSRLGESSVTLLTEIFNHRGEPAAMVRTTHVFVSKPKMKKRPIPDHLKRFLASQQTSNS